MFIFAPTPSSGYALGGQYFAQPAILSATNTSNFLTTTFPGMLLAACMAEATAFTKDLQKTEYWESRLAMYLNGARMGDRTEKFSGSPLSMVPG